MHDTWCRYYSVTLTRTNSKQTCGSTMATSPTRSATSASASRVESRAHLPRRTGRSRSTSLRKAALGTSSRSCCSVPMTRTQRWHVISCRPVLRDQWYAPNSNRKRHCEIAQCITNQCRDAQNMPTQRSAYMALEINGLNFGTYLMVEELDSEVCRAACWCGWQGLAV
jgi:hypothetical protein